MFEPLFDVMNPFLNTQIFSVFTSETSSFQYCNHRIEVRTPARIRPYPTGRLFWVTISRHFVPGYDRTVPPGQKPFAVGLASGLDGFVRPLTTPTTRTIRF